MGRFLYHMMLFNAFSIVFSYIQPFGTGEGILEDAMADKRMHASAVEVAIHKTILRLPSNKMKAAQSVCKHGC